MYVVLSEVVMYCFFFNDTATTEIYTLSLHDALPICTLPIHGRPPRPRLDNPNVGRRSEEHTSELQSRRDLVCRLLLEKKKTHMGSRSRYAMPNPPPHSTDTATNAKIATFPTSSLNCR